MGVIRAAKEEGKCVQVIVPETRPALQGARLTAYELKEDGIPVTLVCDTAIGHLMQLGRIHKVLVGADRVMRSGHVFNKIGTYQIAVLAHKHKVPFYPVAPASSFDLQNEWKDVVIEERPYEEVVFIKGRRVAPKGVGVFNPVFDVTPPELITAIVSDRGIIRPPFEESIPKLFKDG